MSDEFLMDLEVRIFPLRGEGYPVEFTLAGERAFPRGHLDPAVASWAASGNPVADGQQLIERLLADPVLQQAWAEIRGAAPQRAIRLRIDLGAAELHGLPWELLHEETVMLAAHAHTPFSRYLPVALPWGGAVDERPIRVLAAISNPGDLANYNLEPFDVAVERAALAAALGEIDPGELSLTVLEPPVTLERLEAALRQGAHVLHYLGHGAFSQRRGQAVLYLQDGAGNAAIVPDDEIACMLARQDVHPRLVFLAACQSASRDTGDAFRGLAPKLVSVGVPAVIAMQDFVPVETARTFSTVFYQRLLAHGRVDKAANEARATLLTAGRPAAAVPVLFMRLRSGQLWGAEADARGQVLGSKNPRVFWSGLVRMIEQKKCTPIIGPRVHGRWLPTPREIALSWSELHGYPFEDAHELPRVAQYLASNQGKDFPRWEAVDALRCYLHARLPEELRPEADCETATQLLRAVGWSNLVADDPNEAHRVLASLDLPLYLTTNFDSLMFEALAAAGKEPAREVCRWNRLLDGLPSLFEDDPNYVPTPEAPLVYHLFGSDEAVDSLVLSEDDYLDFLVRVSAEMERVPHFIRGAIASSSLLFVGYSLHDWEFRVILRGLVASADQRRRFKHVAVQLEFDEAGRADTAAVQSFLQQYFQDAEINVFWGSTQQFMAELRAEWEGK
ncbi:MAG: CHAT domain-containing protein [Anaerolineae bacterium]|nr:CHAT domain-containing protein [Anaerolineae bacterium]